MTYGPGQVDNEVTIRVVVGAAAEDAAAKP
jgi:hypothetical protein